MEFWEGLVGGGGGGWGGEGLGLPKQSYLWSVSRRGMQAVKAR